MKTKSKLEERIDAAIDGYDIQKINSVKDQLGQLTQLSHFAEKLLEKIQDSDIISVEISRDVGYASFWLEEYGTALERFEEILNITTKFIRE